ncbi:MAG: hypothetical protein M3Z02_06570 [Actinomycetota bacterium]|nr:hypothetical protein [Actinomycetota bacterium]
MTGPAGRRRVVLAAAALAAGWLLAPSAPPLYDGIGFPDEPYRLVAAPAGPGLPATPPPTEARDSSPVVNGTNSRQVLAQSAEQGPQVLVSVSVSVLRPPAGATAVEVSARPLAPTEQPGDGRIVGNVYRVTAGAGGQQVPIDDRSGLSVIVLRAPAGGPGIVLEYRPEGGSWKRLGTAAVGADIYQSQLLGAGDYALAALTAAPPARDSSSGVTGILLMVGLLLLVMAAVVLLVRLRAARPSR